ncbi:FliI/YscN family ATPase [Opitutales bacterium]|nr:FliI/YscN family ATPase [Opitutales bacterium]MDA9118749.1 FliI/YscN family ATPase [Opitutales bacterium]MDC1490240.1 FliI/YscN family ATPase [bacterium]MDC3283893.1 FliI/YscN family ATPase [Opitutales bacterium]
MVNSLSERFSLLQNGVRGVRTFDKVGVVRRVTGLVIESEGPEASIGQVCSITSDRSAEKIEAQVIGFRENVVLLMALNSIHLIHPGCKVISRRNSNEVPFGPSLLGRIIDGMGRPIDGKGPLVAPSRDGFYADPPNPLSRSRIKEPFASGIKSIDCFIPMGVGQRIGIFAGSGVGKSILLGMIAKGSDADVNVISLVGERGRELREFVESDLGEEGLRKSIVVVSTSDQPAPMRIRASILATAIAEGFRNEGQKVLLLMDSLTRFAMAQREIGLASGEPPASRGYVPSVFSLLPKLLERTGTSELGAITSIYTVLVEGDDMNEPVADAVRGFLDGHIVLSRKLANANHFPAVDVLSSVSRLDRSVCNEEELSLISHARDLLSTYHQNEDMINVGAYVKNSNPKIDLAIDKFTGIQDFLRQKFDFLAKRENAFSELRNVLR